MDLYQSTGSSVLPNTLSSAISMIESDRFAAFPSLHAAYVMIFAYFTIKLDRRLAFVAIPVLVAVLFSTLYLGQHYLIDLVAGALYALVPCLISERLYFKIPRKSTKEEGRRPVDATVGMQKGAVPSGSKAS